jgi:hypothetical protein
MPKQKQTADSQNKVQEPVKENKSEPQSEPETKPKTETKKKTKKEAVQVPVLEKPVEEQVQPKPEPKKKVTKKVTEQPTKVETNIEVKSEPESKKKPTKKVTEPPVQVETNTEVKSEPKPEPNKKATKKVTEPSVQVEKPVEEPKKKTTKKTVEKPEAEPKKAETKKAEPKKPEPKKPEPKKKETKPKSKKTESPKEEDALQTNQEDNGGFTDEVVADLKAQLQEILPKLLAPQKPDYIIVSFFPELAGKSIKETFDNLSSEEKIFFSGYYEIKLTDENKLGYTERFEFFNDCKDREILEGFIRETMENDCIIFKGLCDYVMIIQIMSILVGNLVKMETVNKFKCASPQNSVFINLISEWTLEEIEDSSV